VGSESMIPEMAASYLRDRLAKFRKIQRSGKMAYIGRREYEIEGDNVLESKEVGKDVREQLSTGFLQGIWDLYEDEIEPPGRNRILSELQEELADDFLVTIKNMDKETRKELVEKLRNTPELKEVPFFCHRDETGDLAVIEMESGWYRAVINYYKAWEQIEARNQERSEGKR